MNNNDILETIKASFYKYLETDPRSNEKLKILHGDIAKDLQERLGKDYKVYSLGYKAGKEIEMEGRYMKKKVDIAIKKDNEIVAGIALKFIMSNYNQNSNNYFENMLGETANIRVTNKPYYQILIIPSKVPYYKKAGEISKIETITEHNLEKYIKLSEDNINESIHIPNKMLIYIIDIPDYPKNINNKKDYIEYYQKNNHIKFTTNKKIYPFGDIVIHNDYNKFLTHIINSLK